jgi:hypothetical protein
MRIYQNIDGGETDVISDGYKMVVLEQFEGIVTEIQSRMVVKGDVNVDVGCGNAFGGKNEDEEEGGAGGEVPPEKVNDLIDAFNYQEANFGKPELITWFKEYGKKVIDSLTKQGANEEKQNKFKAGFKAFAGHVIKNLGEFTIYTPSDYNSEGTLIFSFWKHETDEAPTFWFVLDGLKSFKV